MTVVGAGLTATTDAEGHYVITSVPTGAQTIAITKEGYTAIIVSVMVAAGVTVTATPSGNTGSVIQLETSGSISVVSSPPGALIYLDSVSTGLTTPSVFSGVAPGTHTVGAALEGYERPVDIQVTVAANVEAPAVFELTIIPACDSDADCDDDDVRTADTCMNPGVAAAGCSHSPITCLNDSECDDANALTLDSCDGDGTAASVCSSVVFACNTAADCADGDAHTTDVCANGGTATAACSHEAIACLADSECADTDPLTIDVCNDAGTTAAACVNTLEATPPTVSAFSPADGETQVSCDGTSFRVVFSESMNTSVDLNNSATLAASGFSLTLRKASSGVSMTMNSTNALNYGVFSWTATNAPGDTLVFTLYSSAALSANGLKTLLCGETYEVVSRTPPSNLTDLAGNAVDASSIAATGWFTTESVLTLTGPTASGVYAQNQAIEVSWLAGGVSGLSLYVESKKFGKQLAAAGLDGSADGVYYWTPSYADYRLVKEFRLILEGTDGAGNPISSAYSAELTLDNNPPAGMSNDFSKLFDITDMAYGYYGGAAGCADHAVKMIEFASAYGFSVRYIHLVVENIESHVNVEAFDEELGKWVLFDPTFDLYFTVAGAPASAFEMHTALVSGGMDSMGFVKYDATVFRFENYFLNGMTLFKNFCVTLGDPLGYSGWFFYSDQYSVGWDHCSYRHDDSNMLYLRPENISMSPGLVSFTTDTGTQTYDLGQFIYNPTFNGTEYINSPANILNDYFRPLFFGTTEYMPEGDFEADTDADGVADGWTATGLAAAALTTEDVLSGTYSQRLEFGPAGGTFTYTVTTPLSVTMPFYHVTGFYKLLQGGVSLVTPPNGSCCDSGPFADISVHYTPGNWNLLYTASSELNPWIANEITIQADPNTVILLDGFHLLKNEP